MTTNETAKADWARELELAYLRLPTSGQLDLAAFIRQHCVPKSALQSCVDSLNEFVEGFQELRDCVLSQRHHLEEPCLDNDQTNAVLHQIDECKAKGFEKYYSSITQAKEFLK
jgi:hypothetical protein